MIREFMPQPSRWLRSAAVGCDCEKVRQGMWNDFMEFLGIRGATDSDDSMMAKNKKSRRT